MNLVNFREIAYFINSDSKIFPASQAFQTWSWDLLLHNILKFKPVIEQ